MSISGLIGGELGVGSGLPTKRRSADHPVFQPSAEVLSTGAAAAGPSNVSVPHFPIGARIDASDEQGFGMLLGEGWRLSEPWGRWTHGHEAVPLFRIEGGADGDLELLLYARAYLPSGRLFQRVAVSINGWLLLCWKLGRDTAQKPLRLPIYQELVAGDGCRIVFHLPDADSPSAWGKRYVRILGSG